MTAWLLTWNPDNFVIDEDEYQERVTTSRRGQPVIDNWSTGQNRDRIQPGDTVYWLRQGSQGRGIVGSGKATSQIWAEAHFQDAKKMANYVDVEWWTVVPVEDRLDTADLVQDVPDVKWQYVLGSGQQVNEMAEGTLAQRWQQHLRGLGR